MNLKDLYDVTPVARHGDITVASGHVYVRDAAGNVTEHLLHPDGELWKLREDKANRDDLAKLKADIASLKATVAAIKAKVGA